MKWSIKIIGYAAGYEDYDFALIDATKLTHINFAFANIVEGKAAFELKTDAAKIATLIGLKAKNPDLKVLYSVGGWVWSDQFSTMAAYESSRKKFAESCVELLKKHEFDGVDLDWEYPGQRAEDNDFTFKVILLPFESTAVFTPDLLILPSISTCSNW